MRRVMIGAIALMVLVGCDARGTPDETTTCTTDSNGDTKCRTYYKDSAYIDCRTYEDASQGCNSSGMTADEVATVYDREDRMIDVDDEVVVIETAETMIIVEVEE